MNLPLSIPLWLPLAAGVLQLLLPRDAARVLMVAATGALAGWAIGALVDHTPGGGVQNVTDELWISALGVHYKLGLDGLNIALIAMSAFLFLFCLVWAIRHDWRSERQVLLLWGLAETGVLGALMAQDLALFIVFFDLMLIPFLLLGLGWGDIRDREQRTRAMIKLFIYTLAGSLLMLAAAVATAVLAAGGTDGAISFAFTDLERAGVPSGSQGWIFLCFAAAFLVKMPGFPFHGWMPDGYRALPLPVLAVFSGALSKVAAYGFIKIVLPLLPQGASDFQMLMLVLAVLSILYGSVMAFTTTNARLVLGYSSLAQLGFITLGIFSLQPDGVQGALLQAVNHGLVVAPAFALVDYLAARTPDDSEDLRSFGGIAFRAPILATMFLIVALATLAMPGFSNFIGEFYILLGAFQTEPVIAIIASIGVALASVYGLRLFIRAMHNRHNPDTDSRELDAGESLVLIPMVLVIVALAFVPQFLLERSAPDASQASSAVCQLEDCAVPAAHAAKGETP